MATRFRSEYKDFNNVVWKIDLDDATYSGAVTDFRVRDNGFEHSYETQNDEIVPPITSSRLTFQMYVNSAISAAIASLEADFAGAPEGRFTLKISRDTVFYWAGYVLADLAVIEDNLPYFFSIAATDGLGRLKNKPYKDEGTNAAYGNIPIIQHILNCLNKDALSALYWNTSPDIFLRTVVDWWHEGMSGEATAKDPLALSRFNGEIFAKKNRDGTYEYKSCYDVLEVIARTFRCRLYASQGGYRFEQADHRLNNNFNERRWSRNATMVSSAVQNLDRSMPQNLSGAKMEGITYEFIAGLLKAEVEYEHKTAKNWMAGLSLWGSAGTYPNGERDLGVISLDTSASLRISGRIRATLTTSVSVPWYYIINIEVRVGASHVVKRSIIQPAPGVFNVAYEAPTWIAPAGVIQVSPGFVNAQSFDGTFDFSVWTPNLPSGASGNVFVEVASLGAKDQAGTTVTLTSNSWNVESMVLIVAGSANADNFEMDRTYYVNGPATNSEVLKISTPIGSAVQPWTPGKIQVSPNGSSSWADTTAGWYPGGTTGINDQIGQLLARMTMAGQKSPIRRMRGTILGQNMYFHNLVSDLGLFKWLFVGATYNSNMAEWDGEWRGVKYEATTGGGHYTPIDDEVANPGDIPTDGGKFAAGATSANLAKAVAAMIAQAMTSATVSGTITSLPVSVALQAGAFVSGDKIRVLNPDTGMVVELTVSTTNAAGATSIAVTSQALPASFPAYSYISKNYVAAGGIPGISGSPFVQGGNSFGAVANVGTNDAQPLNIETSGAARIGITSGGLVVVGGAYNAPPSPEKLNLLSGNLLLDNGFAISSWDTSVSPLKLPIIRAVAQDLVFTAPINGSIRFFESTSPSATEIATFTWLSPGVYSFSCNTVAAQYFAVGSNPPSGAEGLGVVTFHDVNVYHQHLAAGDGTFAFPVDSHIERQILDRNTSWTTGVTPGFFPITDRRDGLALKYAFIGVDTFGSGAGNNNIQVRKNGTGIGATVTLNSTFQVVDFSTPEAVTKGDVLTLNISSIRATAAKGLSVEFVFCRQ